VWLFSLNTVGFAKPAPGGGARIFCRHAGLDPFLLAQLQVQAHLLFEVRIKLTTMGQPC